MKIVNMDRQSGKSKKILEVAEILGMPVVTANSVAPALKKVAQDLGVSVCIYSLREWNALPHNKRADKVLVDDFELMMEEVLGNYLEADPLVVNMCLPMEKDKNVKTAETQVSVKKKEGDLDKAIAKLRNPFSGESIVVDEEGMDKLREIVKKWGERDRDRDKWQF